MQRIMIAVLMVVPWSAAADEAEEVTKRVEAILSEASNKRDDARQKADRDYRASVVSTFPFANRIEIFLVDFAMGSDAKYKAGRDDETFTIRPYQTKTKILKTFKVPSKAIPAWCKAVAKILTTEKPENDTSFCHYPIHGIRIYAADECLLFETSICWQCNNYYFNYDGESEWIGISEDVDDLKQLLDDSMPIPAAELQRFKASSK